MPMRTWSSFAPGFTAPAGADRARAFLREAREAHRAGRIPEATRAYQAAVMCQRSHDVAVAINDPILQAEALNAMALVYLERGDWTRARDYLARALAVGEASAELRGNIEQNLGVMANIQGDLRAALRHYQSSLEAHRLGNNERGCATAYHNLGMVSADQRQWREADQYVQ